MDTQTITLCIPITLCICGHAHEGRECEMCAGRPEHQRWCSTFVPLREAMKKPRPLSIRERAVLRSFREAALSILMR